jgi:hypothetical protein
MKPARRWLGWPLRRPRDAAHESGERGSAVDDRLPGADLTHQPPLLGSGAGTQYGRLCPLPRHHPQRATRPGFTLDEHGFCLAQHHTAISDWENQYVPDSAYAAEVAEAARRLHRALRGAPCRSALPQGAPRRSGASSEVSRRKAPAGLSKLRAARFEASRAGRWRQMLTFALRSASALMLYSIDEPHHEEL